MYPRLDTAGSTLFIPHRFEKIFTLYNVTAKIKKKEFSFLRFMIHFQNSESEKKFKFQIRKINQYAVSLIFTIYKGKKKTETYTLQVHHMHSHGIFLEEDFRKFNNAFNAISRTVDEISTFLGLRKNTEWCYYLPTSEFENYIVRIFFNLQREYPNPRLCEYFPRKSNLYLDVCKYRGYFYLSEKNNYYDDEIIVSESNEPLWNIMGYLLSNINRKVFFSIKYGMNHILKNLLPMNVVYSFRIRKIRDNMKKSFSKFILSNVILQSKFFRKQ